MMKKILSGILCIMLCLGLCACGGGKQAEGQAPTWQEQYDLGLRYLSEGKYTEAVLAFTAAIEIDAKQALAYVGRGDAYVGVAKLAMPEGADPKATAPEGEALTAYQNAVADYAAAVEADATLAEVYQKAAEVYMILGDKDAAIAILQKGIDATGDQSLSDLMTQLEQNKVQKPDASQTPDASQAPDVSQEPEVSSSPEPDSEPATVTVDFDPVALLRQDISVITDKYGEPTEKMTDTLWRWWPDDNSYDFMVELGTDGATIMSINCGWGAPAILGVKAGDSAEDAQAALNTVGGYLTRDAGNDQINYFTTGEQTNISYDFATRNGSVVYVAVHHVIQD